MVLFVENPLFLFKRKAIGALIHRRIGLVRANADAVERAIRAAGAVVLALLNAALDAMIFLGTSHDGSLLSGNLRGPLSSFSVCPVMSRLCYIRKPPEAISHFFTFCQKLVENFAVGAGGAVQQHDRAGVYPRQQL